MHSFLGPDRAGTDSRSSGPCPQCRPDAGGIPTHAVGGCAAVFVHGLGSERVVLNRKRAPRMLDEAAG